MNYPLESHRGMIIMVTQKRATVIPEMKIIANEDGLAIIVWKSKLV